MAPRKAAARPKSRTETADKRAPVYAGSDVPPVPEWVEGHESVERMLAWPADRWDVRVTYQHSPETVTSC